MYGQDARIGICFQNSYGTALTSSMHWMEPLNDSISLAKAQIQRKGLRGGSYTDPGVQEGANTIAGDVMVEARANQVGVMLAAVCGSPTTVTSAALYTHTFKPRTSDHNLLSAERPFTYYKHMGDAGSAQLYSDLNGGSLELAISNGELLTSKLSVVGGTFSRVGSMAAVYSVSNPIDWSVSSASIGGAALNNVKQLSLTHNNNLEAKFGMGTTNKYPTRIKRTDFATIMVSGTMTFDTQTEYNDFISQTTKQMTISLIGTSNVQSGYPEFLKIDIPSLKYTEFPLPVAGPTEIEISFKAQAEYNVGSATSIAYTLACGKAGF